MIGSPSSSRMRIFVVASLLGAGAPGLARAQAVSTPRVAVSVGGASQVSATTFSQAVTFEQYSEQGSLTSEYTIGRGPAAAGGVTVRLWRRLGVGIAGSRFHSPGSARISATLPHPFAFNQPRQIEGVVTAPRTETGLHVVAAYWTRLGPRLDLLLTAGPSRFRVEQDFVSDVSYAETAPFDTAAFESAARIRKRSTATGGNAGAELGYRVAAHVAVTAAARLSRATVTVAGTSATPLTCGGLQLGGGLRLAF